MNFRASHSHSPEEARTECWLFLTGGTSCQMSPGHMKESLTPLLLTVLYRNVLNLFLRVGSIIQVEKLGL